LITWKEETKTLVEWEEVLGIKYTTLWERFGRGWSVEKAFTAKT
jgi:hypothetical protein